MQNKHAILKNFPVIGYLRYFFEFISPEIQQYFIERNTDGKPFSRNLRSIAYQRSKNLEATSPFGTQLELNNRSEERRVGKECRSWWWECHLKRQRCV